MLKQQSSRAVAFVATISLMSFGTGTGIGFFLDQGDEKILNELRNATTLNVLLRRPEVTHDGLLRAFESEEVPQLVGEQVEIRVKYEGFIARQNQLVEKQKQKQKQHQQDHDQDQIPDDGKEEPSTLRPVVTHVQVVSEAFVPVIKLEMHGFS